MENVNWGVPTKNRIKKTEKYNTPVATMTALTGKGSVRKISLNKALIKALNIVGGETKVQFGFTPDNSIYLGVRDGGLPVKKNYTISEKKTFEYISRVLDITNDIEQELHFVVENDYLTFTHVSSGNAIGDMEVGDEVIILEASIETTEKLEEVKEEVAENLKPTEPALDEKW